MYVASNIFVIWYQPVQHIPCHTHPSVNFILEWYEGTYISTKRSYSQNLAFSYICVCIPVLSLFQLLAPLLVSLLPSSLKIHSTCISCKSLFKSLWPLWLQLTNTFSCFWVANSALPQLGHWGCSGFFSCAVMNFRVCCMEIIRNKAEVERSG